MIASILHGFYTIDTLLQLGIISIILGFIFGYHLHKKQQSKKLFKNYLNYRQLAITYFEVKDYDRCKENIIYALGHYEDYTLHEFLGDIYQLNGQHDLAANSFSKARWTIRNSKSEFEFEQARLFFKAACAYLKCNELIIAEHRVRSAINMLRSVAHNSEINCFFRTVELIILYKILNNKTLLSEFQENSKTLNLEVVKIKAKWIIEHTKYGELTEIPETVLNNSIITDEMIDKYLESDSQKILHRFEYF
jgi:tetratricopeptide (TPR) repeat protein